MCRLPVVVLVLLLLILLINLSLTAFGFSCFSCNTGLDSDDTEPCEEKEEKCSEDDNNTSAAVGGIPSCSTLLYFSNRANPGRPHVRKFCTSPGIPLGSLLERLPLSTAEGNGFCQSVDRWIGQQARLTSPAKFSKARRIIRRINRFRAPSAAVSELQPPPALAHGIARRRRNSQASSVGASPPAPPQSHSSTLLCICTQPLCNGGDFQEILSRSFIGQFDGKNGSSRKAKFEIEQAEEGQQLTDKEVPIR